MMERIGKVEWEAMLCTAAESIRANHALLTELDSIGGDGDHGTTMLRVADQFDLALPQADVTSLSKMLKSLGWSLLNVNGGASSAILGTFFTGMSQCDSEESMDCMKLALAFKSGLNAVMKQSTARPGDKTVIDALAPAIDSLRDLAERGSGIDEALEAAADAARAGAESTKLLVARYGRARYLGETTRGHPDPGATSIALIFAGFSKALSLQRGTTHG